MDKLDSWRFEKALEYFNTQEQTSFYELFKDESYQLRKNPLGSSTSQSEKLVSVIAFCLNPNHYHLILRQECEDGVSRFMQKLGTGYTKYFNERYERTGSLFSGRYKSRLISTDFDLQYISAYVNLNYIVHNININKATVVRSSITHYRDSRSFVNFQEIISLFDNDINKYHIYAQETVEEISERREREKSFLKEELME